MVLSEQAQRHENSDLGQENEARDGRREEQIAHRHGLPRRLPVPQSGALTDPRARLALRERLAPAPALTAL